MPAQSTPYEGALAEYRAGRLESALATIDRARATEVRDARLRFLRGVILAGLGRDEAAIETFRSMTQDFPELPEPYNNLAVLHAGRGDLDAALRALQDAVRAVPTYPLAHENLGDLYLKLAARAYARSRQLDASNASAARKLELTSDLVDRTRPAGGAAGSITPR